MIVKERDDMARKKSCECHSCGKKIYVENAVKLDDEEYPIYWCCEECKSATSETEIVNEKINILFKEVLGVKALNKTVKGYIRNRLNDDFDDKREILFSVLCKKRGKIVEIMCKKTFSNTTIKAKYVFACVKKDVDDIYRAKNEEIKLETVEIPIPVIERAFKKVRNISKWL
jgi:hypothetical protein